MVPEPDSVQRFTNRVHDYVRSRPGYPADLASLARDHFALPSGAAVADVGSGTGKLSRLFLQEGFEVFGVEPNEAMRQAATAELGTWKTFHGLAGAAESLPLADGSMHLVVAAQAFHWFDHPAARREFLRVLRPEGGGMLIWNNRRTDSSRFLQDYEKMLLDHCPDYVNVGNKHYEDVELDEFFAGPFRSALLRNQQVLDAEEFQARIFSCSYTPAQGSARDALAEATQRLFVTYAEKDRVCIEYDTEVFYGRLHPPEL